MHTWTWQYWDNCPYLTCALLDPWPHGFFTQDWWPQLPADLVGAIAPHAQAYRVKQVHGNRVLTVTEIEHQHPSNPSPIREDATPSQSLPEADGVIAEHPAQAAWVATADCVPALIADRQSGRVASVHAGWRGTAQKIVPVTIRRLLEQGSRLSDLRVALGPAIAGEVYQVSTTVAAQVGTTVLSPAHSTEEARMKKDEPLAIARPDLLHPDEADTAAILDALKALPQPPILDDPQPGRARLDVRRINTLQLEHMGLMPEQIAVAPYCTYQNGDRFFSYRRNRLKKVQWSGIVPI